MPYVSPPTLTRNERVALLRKTASHPRDHLLISMALGTGLRPVELVGLNVGDVFAADRKPTLASIATARRPFGPSTPG